jgi:hypothetical protein
MQRIAQVVARLALVCALVVPTYAGAQGPEPAAGAGSQVAGRFVLFEAFMRPT